MYSYVHCNGGGTAPIFPPSITNCIFGYWKETIFSQRKPIFCTLNCFLGAVGEAFFHPLKFQPSNQCFWRLKKVDQLVRIGGRGVGNVDHKCQRENILFFRDPSLTSVFLLINAKDFPCAKSFLAHPTSWGLAGTIIQLPRHTANLADHARLQHCQHLLLADEPLHLKSKDR